MRHFPMCPDCQQEYATPDDRRFHSQTNTCATCGMQVWLREEKKKITEAPLTQAIKHLQGGKIIAVRSPSGYLLCADARRPDTLQRLRRHKHRPHKPFALLYPSLEQVCGDFHPSKAEAQALDSPLAPIVLLSADPETLPFAAAEVAPNLRQFGVMLPASSLLFLLSQQMGTPLVATSGNRHDSPILAEPKEAHTHLHDLADGFLEHNLPITFPQDDTVMRFADEHPILLRRARAGSELSQTAAGIGTRTGYGC
mgnify:CR=1 FL=1